MPWKRQEFLSALRQCTSASIFITKVFTIFTLTSTTRSYSRVYSQLKSFTLLNINEYLTHTLRLICVANIKKAYITYYLIIVRLIGPKPFLFLGISHSLQTSHASTCRNGHSISFQCSYTIMKASLQAAHAIMITFFTSCMAASCMFMFVLLLNLRDCTCRFFFTPCVALLGLFFFIRCVALLVPFFTRCMDVLVLFFYPLCSFAYPFLPVA